MKFIPGKLYRVGVTKLDFWLDPYLGEKDGGQPRLAEQRSDGSPLMFIRSFLLPGNKGDGFDYECFVFLEAKGRLVHAERVLKDVDYFIECFEGPLS